MTHLSPRIVDALYTEAMLLADEARDYFEDGGADDRDGLDPETRVLFSCEALRVTTRLMHVVAWLLTRRAVTAGELDERQASSHRHRLSPEQPSDPAVVAILPDRARALVAATIELHARALRLDAAREDDATKGCPARSLLARLERAL